MLVDMPLDRLKEYRGINPRPVHFDLYWKSAVEEMEALGTKCIIEQASFQAPGVECFDLTFTGVMGSRIYAKYLLPAQRTGKVPAVLRFHGYSMSSESWMEHMNYVCAGFAVLAMDCRGQGGRSEDLTPVIGPTMTGHIIRGVADPDPRKLYYRQVFLDAAQLARIASAQPEIDENRLCIWGGSQGGGVGIACAALTPWIHRVGVYVPFLSDYRRVWEMDLCKNAYEEIVWYFRRFDPMHEHADAFFERLGYIDVHHLAERVQADTLMLTGLMDTTCPPSTQFAIYNQLKCAKEMKIFPDYVHERPAGFNDLFLQHYLK